MSGVETAQVYDLPTCRPLIAKLESSLMVGPDLRIPDSPVFGMNDEELCWAVVETVWPDEQTANELEHIEKATPGQRAIYATMLYACEVDNGGVRQFLSNSSGMYAGHVLEGLTLVGATGLQRALEGVAAHSRTVSYRPIKMSVGD